MEEKKREALFVEEKRRFPPIELSDERAMARIADKRYRRAWATRCLRLTASRWYLIACARQRAAALR
jgi:hypothetical protein